MKYGRMQQAGVGSKQVRASISIKVLNPFLETGTQFCAVRCTLCQTCQRLMVLLHQTSKNIKAAIKTDPALYSFMVFLLLHALVTTLKKQ